MSPLDVKLKKKKRKENKKNNKHKHSTTNKYQTEGKRD